MATPPKATVPNFPPNPLKIFLESINIVPAKKPANRINLISGATCKDVMPTKDPQYTAAGSSFNTEDLLFTCGANDATNPTKLAEIIGPSLASVFK